MNDFSYKLRRSKRAKNISLSVYSDSRVILTIPWWVPVFVGKKFLESKRQWVIDKLRVKGEELKTRKRSTRKDYLKNKEKARKFIKSRIEYLNQCYGFEYKRISIRDTRTRWGSCSAKGNLNFSYKLLFLPKELADYVIVHELCHLKEMNHSKKFWDLVERMAPDHKQIRKKIRSFI